MNKDPKLQTFDILIQDQINEDLPILLQKRLLNYLADNTELSIGNHANPADWTHIISTTLLLANCF